MAAQQKLTTPTPLAVDSNGAIPTITVDVGQAQLGSYEIFLWNTKGKPFRIGRGSTIDNAPDTHRIVRTRDQLGKIDGFVVTVVVVVQALTRGPGALWSCDIDVEQDGKTLDHTHAGGPVAQALETVSCAYEVKLV